MNKPCVGAVNVDYIRQFTRLSMNANWTIRYDLGLVTHPQSLFVSNSGCV